MSEQAVHGTTAAGSSASRVTRTRSRSLWVGWVFFGGATMIMLGAFNLIEGFVALFNDEYYVPTPQGLLLFDLTAWGWIHVITGALAVVVGIGVFSGATWARLCGVIVCGFNAIAQLAFLSAYPVWAILVIALDVLVIYALIAHGDGLDKDPDR